MMFTIVYHVLDEESDNVIRLTYSDRKMDQALRDLMDNPRVTTFTVFRRTVD